MGYEGFYVVSSKGKVSSVERWTTKKDGRNHRYPAKLLAQAKTDKGYFKVVLSKNGKTKNFFVHSLVAAAFLGKKPNGLQVDHIDNDRQNNKVENLQYISASKNTNLSIKDEMSECFISEDTLTITLTRAEFEAVKAALIHYGGDNVVKKYETHYEGDMGEWGILCWKVKRELTGHFDAEVIRDAEFEIRTP